jgi:hypothetical protein
MADFTCVTQLCWIFVCVATAAGAGAGAPVPAAGVAGGICCVLL